MTAITFLKITEKKFLWNNPQITFQILPGKQHISVYVCSGTDPNPDWDGSMKKNYDILISFVLTMFLYAYNTLKIRARNMNSSLDTYEKYNMLNSVTILFSLLFYPFTWLVVFGLHGFFSPSELIKFPNYILIHFFQHELVFLWNLYFLVNLFAKSKGLRKAFVRELKLKVEQLACSCRC